MSSHHNDLRQFLCVPFLSVLPTRDGFVDSVERMLHPMASDIPTNEADTIGDCSGELVANCDSSTGAHQVSELAGVLLTPCVTAFVITVILAKRVAGSSGRHGRSKASSIENAWFVVVSVETLADYSLATNASDAAKGTIVLDLLQPTADLHTSFRL